MTTTTDKGLTDEELMAIVDAATPGPWDVDHYDGESQVLGAATDEDGEPGRPIIARHYPAKIGRAKENAEYQATFDPPMVRALIERARGAEARALAMEEALKAVRQVLVDQGSNTCGRNCEAMYDRDIFFEDEIALIDRALSTEAQS